MFVQAKNFFRGITGAGKGGTKQKTYEDWAAKNYLKNPLISFIIQAHNKTDAVLKLIGKLGNFPDSEFILLDDGSNTGDAARLAKALSGANHFLIRTNDLYEVITYDRAIYLARGKYVALLQDDDDFESLNWISEAVDLLNQHPKMVILGGRYGARLLEPDKTEDGLAGPFEMNGNIGGRKNLEKFDLLGTQNGTAGKFRFVPFVNRAPMWLNRALFMNTIGHINQDFAPFQYDDTEMCLRAWKLGLQVGWYNAKFSTGILNGGMRIWNKGFTETQVRKNAAKTYELHGAQLSEIDKMVEASNKAG